MDLGGSIRMVSMLEDQQETITEFFSIATDDEDEGCINAVYEVMEEEEEMDGDQSMGKGSSVSITVDSGADASLFPGHLMQCGDMTSGPIPVLRTPRALRSGPSAFVTLTSS